MSYDESQRDPSRSLLYWVTTEGGWVLDRYLDGAPDFPAVYARRTASPRTLAAAVRDVAPQLRPGPIDVLDDAGDVTATLVVDDRGRVTVQ